MVSLRRSRESAMFYSASAVLFGSFVDLSIVYIVYQPVHYEYGHRVRKKLVHIS